MGFSLMAKMPAPILLEWELGMAQTCFHWGYCIGYENVQGGYSFMSALSFCCMAKVVFLPDGRNNGNGPVRALVLIGFGREWAWARISMVHLLYFYK
jgi:hypothetical protein